MRLRESFWAMLGRETSDTPDEVIEAIRAAMLHALDTYCSNNHYALDVKISFATDVSELWYLRPDLMYSISASQSERVAHQALVNITALFKGHHPSATPSRFGAL
jgi:hypothetical protein